MLCILNGKLGGGGEGGVWMAKGMEKEREMMLFAQNSPIHYSRLPN